MIYQMWSVSLFKSTILALATTSFDESHYWLSAIFVSCFYKTSMVCIFFCQTPVLGQGLWVDLTFANNYKNTNKEKQEQKENIKTPKVGPESQPTKLMFSEFHWTHQSPLTVVLLQWEFDTEDKVLYYILLYIAFSNTWHSTIICHYFRVVKHD